MEITTQTLDGVTVVAVSGEIDGKSAPLAQEQITPLFQPNCKVVLDMSQVTYMSSAGLRLMLLIHRQATAVNGQMALVGLSEEIEETMSATGFLSYFTTHASVASAVEALR